MFALPPSNSRNDGDDVDAASHMQSQFQRLFGMQNYPPEVRKRMHDQESELDQRLKAKAQELLESVARLSAVPAEEAQLSSDATKVPARNFGNRTIAPHVRWIKRILSEIDDGYHEADAVTDSFIAEFLDGLTDHQFNRVTDIMNQYPGLHVHTQLYIRDCFKPFASDEEEDEKYVEWIYHLLVLGESIYERLNAETNLIRLEYFVREGQQIARGVMVDHDDLDFDNDQNYQQLASLFKFAFCLQVLDKHPVFGMRYTRPTPRSNSYWDSYHYEDAKLVQVLMEHADKVDQLIEYSEQQHDIHPANLRAVAEGRAASQNQRMI